MPARPTVRTLRAALLLTGLALLSQGSRTFPDLPPMAPADVPRELAMQTLREKDPLALKLQPISGQHLVGPDGTVKLGVYGAVQVIGLTLDQIRDNIKGFLGTWFGQSPEAFLVVVDVAAYNSKSYFVISDGAGYGAQAYQFPITGNDNVLKALTQIQGLPAVAAKRDIRVARRNPYGAT